MRKLILIFAAAASVTLTSCLNDDNNEPSKFEPVNAGILIYNAAGTTNQMALQNADIGIRMGMFLAEAKKQGAIDNLGNIQVDKIGNVKNYLFGGSPRTEIKKTDNGYDIVYSDSRGIKDDYIRKGTYRLYTNGVDQLSDASQETPWEISFEGSNPYIQYIYDSYPIHYKGGMTKIYNTGNNIYRIDLAGIICYIQPDFKSNWSGSFTWQPGGENLAISANIGKTSKYAGSGHGESFYSFNTSNAASMSYTMADGRMSGYRRVAEGKETCRLNSTSDYNPLEFPSPQVTVTWSNDGNTYTISYNGHEVSSN